MDHKKGVTIPSCYGGKSEQERGEEVAVTAIDGPCRCLMGHKPIEFWN